MPCVALISALVGTAFNYGVARLQVRVRFALVPTVFRAAIAIDPQQRLQFASGKVTDLFSVDVQQIMDLVSSSHQLWTLPLQVAVTLYLLYRQVHWAFAAGAAVLAVFIPINIVIARRIGALTQDMMEARDVRLAATGEMLHGILGVKQLAWEMLCVTRIALARVEEMRFLGARKYLDALCVYLWAATPVLVSLATFSALVWTGDGLSGSKGGLTPSVVFTAVTLLNQLIFPLNAYAWVVTGVLQAVVSFKRMAGLVAGARPGDHTEATTGVPFALLGDSVAVTIQGKFAWPAAAANDEGDRRSTTNRRDDPDQRADEQKRPASSDSVKPTWHLSVLEPASFPFGRVTGVCGAVGAGKSALLRAIARLMSPATGPGSVSSRGGVWQARGVYCVYVSSQPWIRRQSLRRNITEQGQALLAGHELGDDTSAGQVVSGAHHCAVDVAVLDAVVQAIAFEEDLVGFEQGLDTPVSLQRLSGGQAARVALARALYAAWSVTAQDADARVLLLLDDPVAALDASTTDHVLHQAVLGQGAVAAGLQECLPRICTVIATHSESVLRAVHSSVTVGSDGVVEAARGTPAAGGVAGTKPSYTATLQLVRHEATAEAHDGGQSPDADDADDADDAEKRAAGGVTWAVLKAYLASAGWVTIAALAVSMVVMQLTRNGADWWLAQWTSAEAAASVSRHTNSSSAHFGAGKSLAAPWEKSDGAAAWRPLEYLLVFAMIAAVNTVATFARSFLFARAGLQAAVSTHVRLLSRVVAAPMAWFHGTPVGRVVNRFSADQYAVDEALPFQSNILLAQAFGIVGTLVVLAVSSSGVLLIFLPPLGAVYWYIQHVYRSSISRELRRLDSVTRSPLFNRFEECTALESPGLAVLQADHRSSASAACGGEGAMLHQELCALSAELHTNQRMLFANMAGAQWLGVRLQGMGVCVLFVVAMSAALQFIWAADTETGTQGPPASSTHTPAARGRAAGSAGLALAYALPIVGSLQGLIAAFAATEQEAISAERIHEYCSVQGEDAQGSHAEVARGLHMSASLATACDLAQPAGRCSTVCTMCRSGEKDQPQAAEASLLSRARQLQGASGTADSVSVDVDAFLVSAHGSVQGLPPAGESLREPLLGTELPPSPRTARRRVHDSSVGGAPKGISIVFENLKVSYADPEAARRPLALDLGGHQLHLAPGTRMAVSGRTGSGKSTLLAALWRLTPRPVGGRVLIDGRDAQQLPLWQLRQMMSYLPQSPVLLRGSVRSNIDPWDEHSDAKCKAALREAFGSDAAPALHSAVGAGGEGLSSGTRQLLALARVLLEARPLVAVDEAAAAVDADSEQRIVHALNALPAHVTLVVVAHREASAAAMSQRLQLAGGRIIGPAPAALAPSAHTAVLAASAHR